MNRYEGFTQKQQNVCERLDTILESREVLRSLTINEVQDSVGTVLGTASLDKRYDSEDLTGYFSSHLGMEVKVVRTNEDLIQTQYRLEVPEAQLSVKLLYSK